MMGRMRGYPFSGARECTHGVFRRLWQALWSCPDCLHDDIEIIALANDMYKNMSEMFDTVEAAVREAERARMLEIKPTDPAPRPASAGNAGSSSDPRGR